MTQTPQQVIPSEAWRGLRVLVVGLGRFGGGVGVTRWLAGAGACVTVTDQAEASSLTASVEAVSGLGVTLRLGGHAACNLASVDLAIINPAVLKSRSPFFEKICDAGVPWTTELNLFCERCPARVVGVTGSYGKSTTCAMLAEILAASQRGSDPVCTSVHLGGNIGRSLLGELDTIRPSDIVVLEMSNAQLEDLPRIHWHPAWAAITNLQPHHLDRYDAASSYFSVKLNLLRRGGSSGRGRDETTPKQDVVVGDLCAEAERLLNERMADRMSDVLRVPEAACEGWPAIELSIPGVHNIANAQCALAVARELGVSDDVSLTALRSFAGLPHRLQLVREVRGVKYFNDSKSTSPAATCVSVAATDTPVVLIAGGEDKSYVELGAWAQAVASRCRLVLCAGASGRRFADALGAVAGCAVRVEVCLDVAAAVSRAAVLTRSGEAVLFSPGAPSFDAYANFVERGEHFETLVRRLSEESIRPE